MTTTSYPAAGRVTAVLPLGSASPTSAPVLVVVAGSSRAGGGTGIGSPTSPPGSALVYYLRVVLFLAVRVLALYAIARVGIR